MAQAHQLFATPFIVDRLASEEGLALLRASILDRQARHPDGISVFNIGGWHSDTDMLDWGGEAARALAHKCIELADAHTHDTKSDGRHRFEWMPEMWANVSQRGASNQFHFHPGSFWSCVAYVDDGYDGRDAGSLEGGELLLSDPRLPAIRMTAPDLRLLDEQGDPAPNEIRHRPKSGSIVMFPSWLQHAVRPFDGDGTRISVAVNLTPVARADLI